MLSTYVPYIIDSWVDPSMFTCKVLILSAMALNENGQNIWSIIFGHIRIPCKRSVLYPWVRILFLCLTMPFWWWAPTPQNVIFWYFELIADRNPLSENLLLSAWYCFTLQLDWDRTFSHADFARKVSYSVKFCMRWTSTKLLTWSTKVVHTQILSFVKILTFEE